MTRPPADANPAPRGVPRGSPAALVLSDGRAFVGHGLGVAARVYGEVVFNTAMSGYQEVLTDPSYSGQFVTFTHPHIGNYGIQARDGESPHAAVAGIVVRRLCRTPSHRQQVLDLEGYLVESGLPGIEGIDTRALVRHIRTRGAQPAVLVTGLAAEPSAAELAALADEARQRGHVPRNAARRAGCARPYEVGPLELSTLRGAHERFPTLVAYDFGIKRGILEQLQALGSRVRVVPPDFPADAVLRLAPDAVFLSNGPGDPSALPEVVVEIRKLLGRLPMFGICLGHQLMGLAFGGRTEKMAFGHRGSNHPVLDRTTGHIGITSQNHGYTVVEASLPPGVEVTHVNLNDGTVEGMRHVRHPAFSVQYHPEARPGPHDTHYHFRQFLERIETWRAAARPTARP